MFKLTKDAQYSCVHKHVHLVPAVTEAGGDGEAVSVGAGAPAERDGEIETKRGGEAEGGKVGARKERGTGGGMIEMAARRDGRGRGHAPVRPCPLRLLLLSRVTKMINKPHSQSKTSVRSRRR